MEGKVELRNWKGEKLEEKDISLILRLVGRTTELDKIYIGDVYGEQEFEFKSPRFPGHFEVITNLIGYANFPAIFTVI